MKINVIPLHQKTDERGSLVQNESEKIRESMKHFFVSYSKPGVVRGQHYHLGKIEWFLVVKGKAEIFMEDIESKERQSLKVESSNPQIVEMPIKVAHSIKNIGDEEMILVAIVNEPLDENNPDTFPYKLI